MRSRVSRPFCEAGELAGGAGARAGAGEGVAAGAGARCGCRSSSRRCRARAGARGLVDLADLLANLNDVAFLLILLDEHARFERRYLDRDLVGLELHQRFVLRDCVALLLQPPRDRRFHDRFAEWWHLYREHSAVFRVSKMQIRR